MQIIVQIRADIADMLHHRSAPSAESRELLELAQSLGIALEPMHPGSAHPELKKFFMAEVADAETAARVINGLQQSPVVEAAYVKPPDAPP